MHKYAYTYLHTYVLHTHTHVGVYIPVDMASGVVGIGDVDERSLVLLRAGGKPCQVRTHGSTAVI